MLRGIARRISAPLAPRLSVCLQQHQFNTTTPAAPFSSAHRLYTENKPPNTANLRAPSAQNATNEDGRKGVVIPASRGSTWFSRFVAWAEGKNREFAERTVRDKREMREMDEREDREERAARVRAAKERLRRG
jgi:hypothetical protein